MIFRFDTEEECTKIGQILIRNMCDLVFLDRTSIQLMYEPQFERAERLIDQIRKERNDSVQNDNARV